MRPPAPFRHESIALPALVERLRDRVGIAIEAIGGGPPEGREVTVRHVHRPGLVLAGYTEHFEHRRVQILGNTECRYLMWLSPEQAAEAFGLLLSFDPPAIVLTAGNRLPDALEALAAEHGVPLFQTPDPTVPFMGLLRDVLEDHFAEQLTVHGSLVDVYGVGLLLTGPAGIGKSEMALDLVERGHRLVADDVVMATRKGDSVVMGAGTTLAEHFMEIRGLGIIDVRAMFGVRAIRFQKRIELVVSIHPWDEDEEYTRIGMVTEMRSILGVDLPLVKLPITPGKNVTVICEVIAMNHLLRHYGNDPAEAFSKRLRDRIDTKAGPAMGRGISWFENDIE
ncbi:HPr(Ser) kinase/phosphatase [Rubrivirga sp. SAORIC476]|uniref:HPr(Ser) kinase/phosphatase n=1 Tax=Rubrivirga sp. SAORIC476 TaxID=1961794 RepID=UPI000BA96D80|nr:HPr(Ser) kinase/phosphatase [Rubrivirga sp. SAORIC476]MAQ94130.1 HPr(Ser) kinase/phosphatase [Rhodothermaceae bacterium]MBC12293.1 HPr(Ser) kinase/phosphatase [Rhodothermaceae bacterium]PAP80654.1 HPr(Ser) kinase/phosphatase [Rubrivirga sp. SAORIC476]